MTIKVECKVRVRQRVTVRLRYGARSSTTTTQACVLPLTVKFEYCDSKESDSILVEPRTVEV